MRTLVRRAGRGYTLIELLVVGAIIGIVGAFALPALDGMLLGARQRSRTTAFVVSAQLARSAALQRDRMVVLCPSDDGERCGKDFARGWIVFEDPNGDRERDTEEDLVDAYAAPAGGPVRSGRSRYAWHSQGLRSSNGTVTFCDAADGSRSRAVVISYTGRPRVTTRLPSGAALPCPKPASASP